MISACATFRFFLVPSAAVGLEAVDEQSTNRRNDTTSSLASQCTSTSTLQTNHRSVYKLMPILLSYCCTKQQFIQNNSKKTYTYLRWYDDMRSEPLHPAVKPGVTSDMSRSALKLGMTSDELTSFPCRGACDDI